MEQNNGLKVHARYEDPENTAQGVYEVNNVLGVLDDWVGESYLVE